jgi:hypothetical protein
MTTSQCHLLQGSRSILAGIFVLTGFVSTVSFIAPMLLAAHNAASYRKMTNFYYKYAFKKSRYDYKSTHCLLAYFLYD